MDIFAAYFRIKGRVNSGITRFKLTALENQSVYQVIGQEKTYTGAKLTNIGLSVKFWRDFKSTTIKLKKVQ